MFRCERATAQSHHANHDHCGGHSVSIHFHDSSQDPAGQDKPLEWDLRTIARVLSNRRWIVLAVAVEIFLLAVAVTWFQTRLYEASARVMIERTLPKVLDSEDVVPVVWNQYEIERFYQTQYLLIKDPSVIKRALDYRGLRDLLIADFEADEEQPANRADTEQLVAAPNDEDLARFIAKGLTIQQLDYSNVVEVSFRHRSPEVAASVVNGLVHAYQDFFVTSGTEARQGASDFLETEIQEAQAELLELERKLSSEREKLGPILPQEGSEMGSERLARIDQELTEAKARRAQAEALVRAYASSDPAGLEVVRNDPNVQRFRDDLTEMKREMAELTARVGPGWPRIRELRDAIEQTERNLLAESRKVYAETLASARAELEVAAQEELRLAGLLEAELSEASGLRRRAQTYDALLREYEQKKSTLERLLSRREEVAVAANLESLLKRQVSIVAEATVPEHPVVPRTFLNLALGAMLGIFLGVGAAFGVEALDNKVRHAEQLAELSGLAVLGTVPRFDGPKAPRLAFQKKKRAHTPRLAAKQNDVEESFRAIRSGLLLSQADHPPSSLVVTSALPGDGKSTVAANLARTLASFGARVVLIDADLRHARLHRVFHVPKERGLTTIIARAMPVRDAVFRSRFENLYVLPAGPCPPDPATLLDPTRLREIARTLTEDLGFDFVLIDTPPLLVFADAFNTLPAVDGVLFVARAMRTPKEAVRTAVAALQKMRVRQLGAILNAEAGEDHSGSYYRYYHYRKRYYAASRRAQETQVLVDGDDGEYTGTLGQPSSGAEHDDRRASGGAPRAG